MALFESRAKLLKHPYEDELQGDKLEDYLTLHKMHDTPEMQLLVYHLQRNIWERQNFINLERDIMNTSGYEYDHETVFEAEEEGGSEDAKAPRRRRRSGSVCGMTIRQRNTLIGDRFRDVGRDHHKVVVLLKKPKNNERPSYMVRIDNPINFPGYLGICYDHPSLLNKFVIGPPDSRSDSDSDSDSLLKLLEAAKTEAATGTIAQQTVNSIISVLGRKQQQQPCGHVDNVSDVKYHVDNVSDVKYHAHFPLPLSFSISLLHLFF